MNISKFSKCANCGACYNACPKDAITVSRDGLFYSPVVDDALCVNCGICVGVCPVNNNIAAHTPVLAVGCWHKNPQIVLNSSSGGVFYGIAQHVLSMGGVVFAAAYSKDRHSVIFTSTEKDLSDLQKSKYVESLIGDSFQMIDKMLKNGRKVLFCGTPCQVAGLKGYLGTDSELLITCDFACGGLPSHKVYEQYLTRLEDRYGAAVSEIDFRPKTHGWKRYAVLIRFQNGKKYNRLGVEDEYLRSFLYGRYTVRDYCLECKFSDCHLSDITLADFWQHKKLSGLENENGISLVLCNSHKGMKAFECISGEYHTEIIDMQQATYNHKPTILHEEDRQKHRNFWQIYDKKGLKHACRKVLPRSFKDKLKHTVIRTCGKRENKT